MAIQFATWGATISGGFLRSTIDQETRWDFDYNLQLTTLADRLGFYAMLFPTRYVGRIGGNEEESGQLDPLTTVAALARATSRLHLISAVLPAFVPPTLLAKVGATIDRISNCLLYTSPSPRDRQKSRMPSSA
jgi:FMNH2-dependent dimethyl sulfone monooxygenase